MSAIARVKTTSELLLWQKKQLCAKELGLRIRATVSPKISSKAAMVKLCKFGYALRSSKKNIYSLHKREADATVRRKSRTSPMEVITKLRKKIILLGS